MIQFNRSEYVKPIPVIQMMPLIDVLFVCLSFFMALFLHFNFESELNVSVPKAAYSTEAQIAPEEIVVNILKDGDVVVNQKPVTLTELGEILKKTASIYPGQSVVVRADQKTFHEDVVRVLDVCANAKIWNISFATVKEN